MKGFIYIVYDCNLVVQERDGNNQPQVTYSRGNDLSGKLQGAGGIGGLLARTDRSAAVPWSGTPGGGIAPFGYHSYYHADGNGNVTILISASQMIVAKYLYDPYGNTQAKSGLLADVNNYRSSSKEWNANSGLYYYLYRLYDPNLQRWLNRDPIGEKGFTLLGSGPLLNLLSTRIISPNSYCDVFNDPVNISDTDGLLGFGWITGLGGVVATFAGYYGNHHMDECPNDKCSTREECNSCCNEGLATSLAGIGPGVVTTWNPIGVAGGIAAVAVAYNKYETCIYKCQSHKDQINRPQLLPGRNGPPGAPYHPPVY